MNVSPVNVQWPARVAVAAALVVSTVFAQSSTLPTDRPAGEAATATETTDRADAFPATRRNVGEGGRDRRDNRDGRDGRDGRDNEPPEFRWGRTPVSAQEWATIEEFLKKYSPNRLELFNSTVEQLGADDNRVQFARRAIATRYRMLRRFESENPQLYAQGLEQVQREDELWGLVTTVQKNPDDKEAKEQLTAKVKAVVRLVLNERQARLERIRKNLDAEEAALKADQGRVDDLVDAQIKKYFEGGILSEMRGGPRGPENRDGGRVGPGGPRDGDHRDGNRRDGEPSYPATRPAQ